MTVKTRMILLVGIVLVLVFGLVVLFTAGSGGTSAAYKAGYQDGVSQARSYNEDGQTWSYGQVQSTCANDWYVNSNSSAAKGDYVSGCLAGFKATIWQ